MKIAFNPSTVAALTAPPNNKDITFDLRGRNIFARGVKFYGTDTNTWRDIKVNNVSIGSHTLDLRNGSNTTLTNTNGVVTINSTWRPVVDNLTSNSTTSSLSANQGRVLAGLINGKSDSDHNHDDRYVKRSGDTMLGALNFANGTWNLVGDDVYMGDHNIGGQLCIMGANGTTGLSFHKYGDASIRKSITFDGNTLYMNGSCDYATLSNQTNLLAINTVPNKTAATSIGSWSPISGRYVFHQKWTDTSTGGDTADFGIYLDGNLTANMVLDGYYNSLLGFRVIGATGGFLKANGTIDNSTYLTSHQSLSNYYTKGEIDNQLGKYKLKSSIWVPETKVIRSNFRDFLNKENLHKQAPEELNLYRFFAQNDESNYSSKYNYPVVDSHAMVFSIDGNNSYIRSMNFDLRSNDIYVTSRVAGGEWRNWVKLLDSSNYSGILDSRYYTESEINSLLDAKLNRQNLSYGTWNPRGYHLAADYHYNGGDLSISENSGQIHVSIDGYFWQNEGKYKVLDTSDVAGLKGNLTVHQYLSATDVTWWPLIWGGDSHNNTNDSTGAVYKSHDKLSWQTGSQTLYATNIQTENIRHLSIGGGIYWNPNVESASDGSDAASITLVKSGVAGGTTLVLSQMNDANDTIQFKTNAAARLYHNSYPILTIQNTYVSNGKGYINGTEITQVNNSDTIDGWHKNNIQWTGYITSGNTLASYWFKMYDITVTGYQYNDITITFLVSEGFSVHFSIFCLRIRQNGTNNSGNYNLGISLYELVGNLRDKVVAYYNNSTGNVQLWGNTGGQWGTMNYTVLKKTTRTATDSASLGTLTAQSFSSVQTPPSTGYSKVTMSRVGSVSYSDSTGSVHWNNVTNKPSSFTPSSHTHTWTSITDKIVAGNEFNIVNAGFKEDLWFNYLPINDRSKSATIKSYRFTNGNRGYTSLVASGFIINGGTSQQLLRADGGVATFNWTGQSGQPTWLWGGNSQHSYYVYNPSNFRVAYAASAGNADTLDGEHASNFVRAGNFESSDLNKLDTYSFIKSAYSTNKDTSPKGNIGWYNVIQAVHRNGASDGPGYIGQIALGMTINTDDMFFRGKRTDPWKTVIHSGNIGSQSVAYASNADMVDGYHASGLWRSDGGTWNPNANISLTASGNNQEWSFDIYRNGHTGCRWHVWDNALGTLLKVNADNGKVYAPYNFVGNLEGNANTANSANSATNADKVDGWHKDEINRTLFITSGISGLSSYWAKLWEINLNNQYNDVTITFLAAASYYPSYFSIFSVYLRQNGTGTSKRISARLVELIGNIAVGDTELRLYVNNTTGNCQLWGNVKSQYGTMNLSVLKKAWRTANDSSNIGTFFSTDFSSVQSLPGDGWNKIGVTQQVLTGTFNPSSHRHDWSQIDNKPATATRWPSWAEVTGKPSSLKNPYAIKFKDINGNVATYDGSAAKDLTAGTYIAKLPYGFASFTSGATWGNTTGTSFASWNDSTGGSIDFRRDNPSKGKMSIKVNGRVYVNEGANPVLSAEYGNSFWGMRTPDGVNDWIRTPNNGLIPYVSGGAGGGHSSLGTSTWYFSTAYIDKVYGSLKGNADSATSTTKVIVNQHTTNDANYPLVWSNQSNTNDTTENQLFKSWADLYYNPKNKRLCVAGSAIIGASAVPSYTLDVRGSVIASSWLRTRGASGWYSESYGGGIYMSDTTWIRTFGDKPFYCNKQIYSSDSIRMGDIYLQNKNEINNGANGILYLNFKNAGNISLGNGGGCTIVGPYTTGDTGNNKLFVNGSEFIDGASNVRQHVFANGFRHRSHNSNDSVLLAGGGYSVGCIIKYWAIYSIWLRPTTVNFSKMSGNHSFISTMSWEKTGSAILEIKYPSGFSESSTMIFGNGDHQGYHYDAPVYVTISKNYGSNDKLRITLANDTSLDEGEAYLYFLCMG